VIIVFGSGAGNFSGAGGIQAFGIDAPTGALTPVAGSPFPASGAFYLTAVQVPPPFLQ